MPNLADFIEEHIKKLLSLSDSNSIELQRKELSLKFNCVPSQINYVLATRFTPSRGYLVETRRGGKGYIRVVRLAFPRENQLNYLWKRLDGQLESRDALELLDWLFEEKAITLREKKLLQSVTSLIQEMEEVNELSKEMAGDYRKKLFKNVLAALASQ